MSREKIQKAFGDAAKKLSELVKHHELHGAELTEAEFTKGFAFLDSTLYTVREQSRAARAMSVAASGKFSFDMELPAAPAPVVPLPTEATSRLSVRPQPSVAQALAAQRQRPDAAPKAVGRLVKDPEAVGEDAGQVVFDVPQMNDPLTKPDPQGDVDFIDE